MFKTFETELAGRKLVIETGKMAGLANGSVLVRYGDNVVLSTAVVVNNANILSDFFPLMVLYQEKLYSVGKIPGGFIKREGRGEMKEKYLTCVDIYESYIIYVHICIYHMYTYIYNTYIIYTLGP